jgi:uncharacterized protein (DUF1697 family)
MAASMSSVIALLRAVNVTGHNRLTMAALREVLTGMGLGDVRTLLQSGNVVFAARPQPAAQLEGALERATAAQLGVTTDYVVRTPKEWTAMIEGNPFAREAAATPNLMLVMALKQAPEAAAAAAFERAHAGPERLSVQGRHVYLVYPDGVGRSRLTGALIEKRLGVRGTARNWNTVLKLAAMVGP